MSKNRMFLVCAHHQEIESSLCLAERGLGRYECAPTVYLDDASALEDFFLKHFHCGKGDHFKLAYQYPRDHDADKPKVAEAINGVLHGSH